MRRISTAMHHRDIRYLERAESKMRAYKMTEALIEHRSSGLWSEVK